MSRREAVIATNFVMTFVAPLRASNWLFLSASPSISRTYPASMERFRPRALRRISIGDVKTALSIDLADLSQRWGIMEASRRISAVRSASNARTKAMRDRPTPPRDVEMRHGKRPADEPPSLDDLLREEMQ